MGFTPHSTIFLVDSGTTMWESRASDEKTALEKASEVIQNMIHKKLMAARKTDRVGMIQYGVDDTKNDLNDLDTEQYENVFEAAKLDSADIGLLSYCMDMPKGHRQGDFLDGMVVAVSALIKFIGQKKQKPAIYVFTDAQTPISTGEDDASSMDAIQNQCKKAGIELKFLIDKLPSEEELDNPKTERQQTARLLKDFCAEVGEGSDVFDLDDALELTLEPTFLIKEVESAIMFRDRLILGKPDDPSAIVCHIHMYSETMEGKAPTAGKISKVSIEAQGLSESRTFGVSKTTVHYVVKYDKNWEPVEEIPVPKEIQVCGYRYGESVIKVTQTEVDLLNLANYAILEEGMYLLGFVHKSSIRREWYLNNTQIVVPIPNDLASQVHIAALTKALFAESRYALVRMIHHKRIKYGILIPVEQKPEDEGEQVKHKLRFIQMPFAEDVREYQFSNLQLVGGDNKRMRKGIKQGLTVDVIMDKTKNFIDALDVDSHMKADEVEPYSSFHTPNPYIARMQECVRRRATFPDEAMAPLSDEIKKMIGRNSTLWNNAAEEVRDFADLFEFHNVAKKKRAQVQFVEGHKMTAEEYRDMRLQPESQNGDGAPAPDNQEGGEDEEYNDVPTRKRMRISKKSPIDDMNGYLQDRSEDRVFDIHRSTSQSLLSIIEETDDPQNFPQLVKHIKEFHQSCRGEESDHIYNYFLYRVKELCLVTKPSLKGLFLSLEKTQAQTSLLDELGMEETPEQFWSSLKVHYKNKGVTQADAL